MSPIISDFSKIKNEFKNELFQNVIPFWESYSIDKHHGGFYNCLDRNGKVFDSTKHSWLQARQVWMFSKLYNEFDQKEQWFEYSKHGIDFLRRNAVRTDNRVYFSLTKEGKPIYLQRKIFSECFYLHAIAEHAVSSNTEELNSEVEDMFNSIWELAFTPGMTGRVEYEGENILQTLAVPMILLNVIEEISTNNLEKYRSRIMELIYKIKLHYMNEKLYENVSRNGDQSSTSILRLLNPGHAIEAGWFLLSWAIKLGDKDLSKFSARIIRNSFELGWDKEYGGLFYFLDAEGFSPTQLEWDMKLWWPHCEAMYALLLLYSTFREEDDWTRFLQVKDYTFSHFPDPKYGEWFGYLNRKGEVTHYFKGGPYKGCFHVPRSLYYCYKQLKSLEEESE